MLALSSALRRASLLACAFVLLCAALASAAEPALSADFDGDGRRDCVTLDLREPSLLRVWLSSTGTTSVIRSSTPFIRIVAQDLDGDSRAELIARDSSPRLRIWTKKPRGFRPYHPHRRTSPKLTPFKSHAADRSPGADSSQEVSGSGSLEVMTLAARPRAPSAVELLLLTSPPSPLPFTRALAPFAPRPPPLVSV